jgi:hypothetical protein
MASQTKRPKAPATPDESVVGKAALEALAPRRDALPRDRVRTPNTDVEACAIFVMGVARKVQEPALYARFASLPKEEFDLGHVRDLGLLAQAAWYATTQLATASTTSIEAKLPIKLVQRSAERKARMLKVVTYLFDDHPRLGPEVADIILGTGYRDLASDLIRLAKIYLSERATVEKDPKHYRADDEAEALKDADDIIAHLGEARSSAERQWADIVARSWTLLAQSYSEVMAAGCWLLRNEGSAEIFLPLVVAGRIWRTKPKKKGSPEGP